MSEVSTAKNVSKQQRAPRRWIGLALAAALVGAFAAPTGAQAAKFVTVPPATNPSGSGRFMLSIKPSSTSAGTGIAYRLPGGEWQRCVGGTAGLTLSLGPYPDGDYQVLIADDYNFQYWASTGHLYDGFLEACSTHDQPGGAVSVYNFHVGNPPAAQPSGPVVAPAPTPTPAPALAPQPHAATPANVALPLGATTARRYAQGYARTKWHARKPKVIGVHRVNSSKITCRVMWHTKNGKKHSRSVVVTKTSAGVRASAA